MTLQDAESFRCPQRLDAHRALRLAAKRSTRLPLSRRYVEDLLQKDGIRISHETVRYWWNRFGPMFSSQIQKGLAGSLRVLTRNYQRPRISCERELGPRPTPTATFNMKNKLLLLLGLFFLLVSKGFREFDRPSETGKMSKIGL